MNGAHALADCRVVVAHVRFTSEGSVRTLPWDASNTATVPSSPQESQRHTFSGSSRSVWSMPLYEAFGWHAGAFVLPKSAALTGALDRITP